MSSKTIPQMSSSSEKIALTLKGAHTSPAVPAGFILARATPAELDYYGFPQANPAVKGLFSSPVQALIERKWTPKNRIIPDLEVHRGITHVLRPKGARVEQNSGSSQTSPNWSGGVVLSTNTAPVPKFGSPLDGYATPFNQQQHVNYIGADSHVYELYYINAWKFNDLTALTGAPVAGGSSALGGYSTTFNDQQHVNFIGANQHVYELFYGNAWKVNDLTALSGLRSIAQVNSPLAGYQTTFNQQQHVIYLDPNNHLHELFYDSQWHDNDLSNLTHAPVAGNGSRMAAYQTAFNQQQHIIYQGFDGHIHELLYDGSWKHNDLTIAAGSGVIAPISLTPLDGYATEFNRQQHINYIGVDGHIHELFYINSWSHTDLTLAAGAPLPRPGSKLDGYPTEFNRQQHVNYCGNDGHVHELVYDGSWKHNDISALSGSPAGVMIGGFLDGYATGFNQQQHVNYIGTDGHIHELFYDGSWKSNDLTALAVVPWTSAAGFWKVPTVSRPDEPESKDGGWNSSTWVGIDGWNQNDVLQTGTSQQVDSDGDTTYYAWYEWFGPDQDGSPDYIYEVKIKNFGVYAGQELFASAQYINGNSRGRLFLANVNSGDYFTIDLDPPPGVQFNGASVEWIMEDPDGGETDTSLAAFTPVEFTSAFGADAAGNSADPSKGFTAVIQRGSTTLTAVTTTLGDCIIRYLPWHDNDLNAAAGGESAGASNALDGYATDFNRQQHVNYIGADNHIHELFYINSWQTNDLTALAGAPNPRANSPLDGYSTEFNQQQHVNFIGADLHVHELLYDGSWKHNDLTVAAGAAGLLPGANSPLDGYATEFNRQQHVNYITAAGHVCELYYDGSWKHNDLTALAGAPPAAGASPLDGYATGFNQQQHINYIGVDGHIHELFYNGSWKHNDLTIAAGAPLPMANSPLDGYSTEFNNQQHVNFIGADFHVYELYYDNGWHHNDLTALSAGAPNAAANSRLDGYATVYNSQQHVNYVGTDNHIHELFFDGAWKHNDLSFASGLFSVPATSAQLVGYQTIFNQQQHVLFLGTDRQVHELFF